MLSAFFAKFKRITARQKNRLCYIHNIRKDYAESFFCTDLNGSNRTNSSTTGFRFSVWNCYGNQKRTELTSQADQ